MSPMEGMADALLEMCHRAQVDERAVSVTISFETMQDAQRFRRTIIDQHRHHMMTHNPPSMPGGFVLNGIRFLLEVKAREVPLP